VKQFKKLLVVLNPFDAFNIEVDHALRIAKSNDAEIDLVAFHHYSEISLLERIKPEINIREQIEKNTLDQITQKIEPLIEKGIKINARIEWCNHITAAIFDLTKNTNYDLLIKAPNRYSPLKSMTTTPTDWTLLRTCPCPVWLARQETQFNQDILAAIDIGDESATNITIATEIIHQANYLAHLLGRKLHIITAFPAMPAAAQLQFVSIYENDYLQEVKTRYSKVLDEILEPFDIPDNHRHVISGDADQVIYDYIKHNPASVLVMGTAAREGVAGLLSGNTAERIINRVECDLLVVRKPKV